MDNFMEREEIVSLKAEGGYRDNWGKCDVCGFDSEVHNCSGYSPKEDEIKVGYKVCHWCLLTLNYGE